MTDTIAELRAMLAKATAGPWATQPPSPYPEDNGIGIIGLLLNDDGAPLDTPTNGLVAVGVQSPVEADEGDYARAQANSDLIVAMRNTLPALLDRVEAGEVAIAALEDRAGNAERRYRHTRQWNAERWERITAYAKEHGFWDDIACIMANGTLNMSEGRAYDPPTYAQQLNIAIHRADAAEDRASKMQGRLEEAESSLKWAEDAMREMFSYYDGGETRGSYDGKPERNGLRKAWHQVRSTLYALQQKADTP